MTHPDLVLATLVSTVDALDGGVEVGITLTVHGTIVDGLLIGAAQWMADNEALLADRVPATTPDGPAGHGFTGLFSGAHDLMTTAVSNRAGVQDALEKAEIDDAAQARVARLIGDEFTPRFIHLRHAKYWQPGAIDTIPMPGNPGMLWRGRLTDVAGWSMGTFQQDFTSRG